MVARPNNRICTQDEVKIRVNRQATGAAHTVPISLPQTIASKDSHPLQTISGRAAKIHVGHSEVLSTLARRDREIDFLRSVFGIIHSGGVSPMKQKESQLNGIEHV